MEKEECEHDQPFWECEICGNVKTNKKGFCSICKLNETCQNNFDYECVEASDFLFNTEIITYCRFCRCILEKGLCPFCNSNVFTIKDDFLDSLIDKDNKALRG